MTPILRFAPGLTVAVAAAYLALAAIPPNDPEGGFQLHEYAKLPVVDRGRVKPLDTLARTNLMVISGRQTFRDQDGHEQPAIRWLLDVTANRLAKNGTAAEKHRVFRIENDQVLNLLGLEERSGFRYAIEEFGKNVTKVEKEANRAQGLEAGQRSEFDNAVLKLAQQLRAYIALAELDTPLAVPPAQGEDEWKSLVQDLREAQSAGNHSPAGLPLAKMLLAYSANDAGEFNRERTEYRSRLNEQMSEQVRLADFEVFFNDFAPFYHCSVLYVFVFVLACLSWVFDARPLNRAGFWLAALTLVVHTWALGARMYIQGRPPVTNLYSSAVFIGWGCVVLALVLEWLYLNGIGLVVGAVTGSLTMLIAHHLAGDGDTLEMMQAVLDTNFWLATHVTCVTLGYTATFVAGFLGILFVLLGVCTRALAKDLLKSLSQMIYGVVCFATLLSFTGTVLGGIWADQSWGRFWGWDPKENGALIIVIWNALILHARWGGMVKQRGMALLAVAGNVVTAWSWFGVNMLGVGLHSYGFMSGAVFWLLAFIFSQLALVGLGLLPTRLWRSFARDTSEGPKSPPRKPHLHRDEPALAGLR